jgi:dCMP deaminase
MTTERLHCGCGKCHKLNVENEHIHKNTILGWDECFARMARIIAHRSKDPNTQAGAVIVSNENVVYGMGYNGFPRGIPNNEFSWEREGDFLSSKYTYIVHAEANAIFNMTTSARNCKIYCTLFPCNECAKAIIQVGIKEVIFECDKYHDENFSIASQRLLNVAGVAYRQYLPEVAW